MKRFHLLMLCALLAALLPAAHPAVAQAPAPARKEYFQGLPLCQPDAYVQEPNNCLALGPADTLTGYARLGLTLPQQPIPARPVSSSLAAIPFQYLLASDKAIPVYASLNEAQSNSPRRNLAAGRKYLAYRQRVENGSGVFYQFQTGEWIRGESVLSRVGYSSDSRGVLFSGVPRTTIGWTIDISETQTAPGTAGRPTGHKIPIYTLVYDYQTVKVDGFYWTMVGPNEWVEDRLIAKVFYKPTPPEGVSNGRWVEINLTEQTVSVYDNHQLVFAALAATGLKTMATRPGLYHVTKKVPAEHMTGAFEADRSDFYYLEAVPWTVYFDEARAIHGVYWRTSYGRPASHGCVNLTIADARWLFDWVKEGDAVYSWFEEQK